jgi:hypothetical protein
MGGAADEIGEIAAAIALRSSLSAGVVASLEQFSIAPNQPWGLGIYRHGTGLVRSLQSSQPNAAEPSPGVRIRLCDCYI